MPFVQAKCPNCGGFLAVDNSKDAAICQFCNTPFVVEKAINNYNINISGNVNVEKATINVEGAPSVINLLIRAHSFVLSKEYDKAISYYNRVLDIDPLNSEAKECIEKITTPKRDNLILERKPSFFSGPIKLYVYVDSEEIGFLKVGDAKSFLLPIGEHTLVFKAKTWFKSMETPPNETRFNIPSSLQCAKIEVKEGRSELKIQRNICDHDSK